MDDRRCSLAALRPSSRPLSLLPSRRPLSSATTIATTDSPRQRRRRLVLLLKNFMAGALYSPVETSLVELISDRLAAWRGILSAQISCFSGGRIIVAVGPGNIF